MISVKLIHASFPNEAAAIDFLMRSGDGQFRGNLDRDPITYPEGSGVKEIGRFVQRISHHGDVVGVQVFRIVELDHDDPKEHARFNTSGARVGWHPGVFTASVFEG